MNVHTDTNDVAAEFAAYAKGHGGEQNLSDDGHCLNDSHDVPCDWQEPGWLQVYGR